MPEHTRQVAVLHVANISTGFISSLGIDFVETLYEAIAESRFGFGFVTQEKKEVIGFAAFTTDISKLYKTVILKKGIKFVFFLAGKMFSPKRVKKLVGTLLYPNKTKKMGLPSAELLSTVVAPRGRRKGLAGELIQKGFQECRRQQIDSVKVLVGTDNMSANKLYMKCGFEFRGHIDNHGVRSNIYVAKI